MLDEQPSYLGFEFGVPLSTIVWIEVILMGTAEVCPLQRYVFPSINIPCNPHVARQKEKKNQHLQYGTVLYCNACDF